MEGATQEEKNGRGRRGELLIRLTQELSAGSLIPTSPADHHHFSSGNVHVHAHRGRSSITTAMLPCHQGLSSEMRAIIWTSERAHPQCSPPEGSRVLPVHRAGHQGQTHPLEDHYPGSSLASQNCPVKPKAAPPASQTQTPHSVAIPPCKHFYSRQQVLLRQQAEQKIVLEMLLKWRWETEVD